MNISIEQANKLLSALLADVAVVENSADAQPDASIDQLLTSVYATVRPAMEEQLRPIFESAFTGRYLGALRSAAQRVFSVSKRELEDMTIEQVLAKCKDVIDTNTSEENATYLSQLDQLKADYETRLSIERSRYTQRDIANRCVTILGQLPRKGGDLQEQAEMLQYKMSNTYEIRYNEAQKQLEFFKDGKQALDENQQPLSDEYFARNWAEKAGILVNDTRNVKPADVKAGQQGSYGVGVITMDDDGDADSAMDAIAAWAGG